MKPLRDDWEFSIQPPPFLVNPLSQEKSETLFLNRFNELFVK
jgi:hypothetical protein